MTAAPVTLYHTEVILPCSLSQFEGQICPARLKHLSEISHPQARACSLTGDLLLNQIIRSLLPQASFPVTRLATPSGKPYLPAYLKLHFSLSHSGNLVVCAISPVPVGIDIELPRPLRPGIAARWFSPEEQNLLADNPSAFFELWMAKEAVLKEIGCGLSGGLQAVSVQLTPTPHLISPVNGKWHALARALLPSNLPVMVAIPGTQPPCVTVHPATQL